MDSTPNIPWNICVVCMRDVRVCCPKCQIFNTNLPCWVVLSAANKGYGHAHCFAAMPCVQTVDR